MFASSVSLLCSIRLWKNRRTNIESLSSGEDWSLLSGENGRTKVQRQKKILIIILIGCYYKIFAKMLTERLKKVVGKLVGDVQNAFIEGRYIFDGIMIANETVGFMKRKKKKGFIFKVEFEKAFDEVLD